MFPATSQVKLLIVQLNIILTAVLSTKYAETRTLLYCLLNLQVAPSGRGGRGRGGRGWWGEGGEGGEERFSVVWPVRGCAGCWVGNSFCHLTPKQEYTILRESFPNKGSYNLFNPKQLTYTPSPLPFGMHLTHVGMMMMSLSVSISYINTQPIKCVTISTCKKHWSGLNISHSVMTAILCIQWFDTQVLIFFILFHD